MNEWIDKRVNEWIDKDLFIVDSLVNSKTRERERERRIGNPREIELFILMMLKQ